MGAQVLPELTVRVEWISGENAILGVQDLKLVDRPLLVGDTVSQMRDLARRGVVIRSECFAELKHLQSGEVVRDVSTGRCLKPICALEPDLFVVYQHWLGQIYEFTEFYHKGFELNTNIFSSSFYVLTGFHGLHVFVGVVLLLALWGIGQRQKGLTLEGGMNLEFVALYWHFVDIVWIVLFTVVYLI